jgi:hypothetical protein
MAPSHWDEHLFEIERRLLEECERLEHWDEILGILNHRKHKGPNKNNSGHQQQKCRTEATNNLPGGRAEKTGWRGIKEEKDERKYPEYQNIPFFTIYIEFRLNFFIEKPLDF